MLLALMLLFIVVPIIEISLFIQVGGFLGVWPTILLILITAVAGAFLVRQQGIATLIAVQNKLQQGEMPTQKIVEGVLLAVAGVLLLIPGFMTDAMGMLILLPPLRSKLAQKLIQTIKVQGRFNHFNDHGQGPSGSHHNPNGDVFDGEYERKDKHNDDNSSNKLR